MMLYKTYKNENVFKENEKIWRMIIITRTINSCLYNQLTYTFRRFRQSLA